FEGFIASEMLKNQLNSGRSRELYFFRDQQGLEVDFLAPGPASKVHLVEVKWTKTVTPAMAAALRKLSASMRSRSPVAVIVHRGDGRGRPALTVAPGVKALSVEDFLTRFPEV
ncbi:MAG: DUF4143 domain-containing protein, partial [Myxococcota bacterium]